MALHLIHDDEGGTHPGGDAVGPAALRRARSPSSHVMRVTTVRASKRRPNSSHQRRRGAPGSLSGKIDRWFVSAAVAHTGPNSTGHRWTTSAAAWPAREMHSRTWLRFASRLIRTKHPTKSFLLMYLIHPSTVPVPRLLPGLSGRRVVALACGGAHPLAVTEGDNAFACLKGESSATAGVFGGSVSGITVEVPGTVDTSQWTAQDWATLAEICD